mmetsp:Transcript_6382/g.14042  ORF Transcript_6382/g.14042 Transcript_6382/m.14042 type:complete len:364 (-) Transcript_6382:595-1686(-)
MGARDTKSMMMAKKMKRSARLPNTDLLSQISLPSTLRSKRVKVAVAVTATRKPTEKLKINLKSKNSARLDRSIVKVHPIITLTTNGGTTLNTKKGSRIITMRIIIKPKLSIKIASRNWQLCQVIMMVVLITNTRERVTKVIINRGITPTMPMVTRSSSRNMMKLQQVDLRDHRLIPPQHLIEISQQQIVLRWAGMLAFKHLLRDGTLQALRNNNQWQVGTLQALQIMVINTTLATVPSMKKAHMSTMVTTSQASILKTWEILINIWQTTIIMASIPRDTNLISMRIMAMRKLFIQREVTMLGHMKVNRTLATCLTRKFPDQIIPPILQTQTLRRLRPHLSLGKRVTRDGRVPPQTLAPRRRPN